MVCTLIAEAISRGQPLLTDGVYANSYPRDLPDGYEAPTMDEEYAPDEDRPRDL